MTVFRYTPLFPLGSPRLGAPMLLLPLYFYLLSSAVLPLLLLVKRRFRPSMSLPSELKYTQYSHSLEAQYLPSIRALISKDLSEPYSIYVYRYFLYQWGHLCFMVNKFRCCVFIPLIPFADRWLGTQSCRLFPHRSHHLQIRDPCLTLTTHAPRLHRHAGCLVIVSWPRRGYCTCQESHRSHG